MESECKAECKPNRSLDQVLEELTMIYDKSVKVSAIMDNFYELAFPLTTAEALPDEEEPVPILGRIMMRLNGILIVLNRSIETGDTAYKQLKELEKTKTLNGDYPS